MPEPLLGRDGAGPIRAAGLGLLTMTAGSVPFLFGNVALVLVGSALAGVAIPWAFVAMATTRQKLTPNHLQGRTASATGLSLQVPQLASTGVGAAVVAVVDYRVLTVIAAAVIGLAGLWLVHRAGRTVLPSGGSGMPPGGSAMPQPAAPTLAG